MVGRKPGRTPADEARDFARSILDSPEYIKATTSRAKRGDKRTLKMLFAYARDSRSTEGRARAREILTAAGRSWQKDA